MKKLSGTTLGDEIVASEKKFTRQQLLRAFVDVCLATEFAHTRGVVHRDLKPANIMLGDFGEVYVLDWGIAKRLDAVESGEYLAPPEASTAPAATVSSAIPDSLGFVNCR